MRTLLFFLLVTFLFSCHKNKEEDKLPKPLRDVIAKIPDCTCDPQLDKILVQDKIYYVMTWHGQTCYIPPVYYDDKGNKIESTVAQTMNLPAGKNLETVWRCRYYIR